jgi:propionyl-CoA carboxylase alpha chain
MRRALDEYYIRGLNHNIPFLAALMGHPRFVKGDLSTGFIAEEYKNGFSVADLPAHEPAQLAAIAAFVHLRHEERATAVSGQLSGRGAHPGEEYVVRSGDYSVTIKTKDIAVKSDWQIGQPLFRGEVKGKPIVAQIDRVGIGYRLFHAGGQFDAKVLSPRAAELMKLMPKKAAPDLSKYLLSPMPGLLVSVAVSEGQEVKAGEVLAVVEAMKMENSLRAERDGKVAKIHANAGDSLAVDQKILEFA